MDADGSHPVEALGGMVRMILADKAEIVVGSRHVAGGGSQRLAAVLALQVALRGVARARSHQHDRSNHGLHGACAARCWPG